MGDKKYKDNISEISDYDADSLDSEEEVKNEDLQNETNGKWIKDGFHCDEYFLNSAKNDAFQTHVFSSEDLSHNIDKFPPEEHLEYKSLNSQPCIDQNTSAYSSPVQGQPYLDRTLINQFHCDTFPRTPLDMHCSSGDLYSNMSNQVMTDLSDGQPLPSQVQNAHVNSDDINFHQGNNNHDHVQLPLQIQQCHVHQINDPDGHHTGFEHNSLMNQYPHDRQTLFVSGHVKKSNPGVVQISGDAVQPLSERAKEHWLPQPCHQTDGDGIHSDDSVELDQSQYKYSETPPDILSQTLQYPVHASEQFQPSSSHDTQLVTSNWPPYQKSQGHYIDEPNASHDLDLDPNPSDSGKSDTDLDADDFQSVSDQSTSTGSSKHCEGDHFEPRNQLDVQRNMIPPESIELLDFSVQMPTPEEQFYDAVEEPLQYEKYAEDSGIQSQISAKLRSSLSWILHKAYRDSIPAEFKDPFYETDQGILQIKPHLVRLLASSEVYCQACDNMFPNTASQWQGHWSIIQVLSRKGIYVTGSDENTVTETVLMKTAPFNADGHLSLISALMVAYASEIVTVERVVQAVRRLTTFSASSELPSGVEDTVMLWINKVCSVAISREPKSQQVLQGETNQKVRIVSRTPVSDVSPPVLHNLIGDLSDGCSLAVLLSFYCPNMLSFGDICLKENLGIADSLYNLRLVKTFCERHLPGGSFSFSYEDLLYTPQTLKENILAFFGELFYWFEIQKFDGSNSSSTAQALSGVPAVSNATKRSFQKADDSRFTSNPELNKSVTSLASISTRKGPLLHKRHLGKTGVNEEPVQCLEPPRHPRRALSLTSPQDRDVIRQSVIAWQEQDDSQSHRPSRTSQVNQSQNSQRSALLANVSIDSELNESFTDDQLGSMNFDSDKSQSPQPTLGDRHNVPSNLHDPNHPDYMEVESVNSRQSNVNSSRSEKLEPLMPAILRPAKEKVSNHTKAQERGEPDSRKKTTSPTKPRKSRSSPVNSVASSQGDVTVEAIVTLSGDVTQTTSSDETVVTPLTDDQLSARSGSGDSDGDSQRKGFEAFYINPDISVEVSLPPVSSQSPRALSVGSHTDEGEVAASYTIDQAHTIDTARAAGIPVVQSSEPSQIRRTTSRDGSVSSSRSSGDFSDHESHKIHLDHKSRETNALSFPAKTGQSPDAEVGQKPKLVITDQLPKTLSQTLADRDKRPQTTNFAEIKRIKDTYGNVDNSGFVYMQNGQDQKDSAKAASLKSAFLRKQGDPAGKKTTFATLPNETTWSAQRAASTNAQAQSNGAELNQPESSELAQLRIKLDEKRKEIEKKKQRMELQHQKMRQRLGKAAFMRVVSRHMDDTPDGTILESTQGERSAAEIEERLGQHVPGAPEAHRPTSLVESAAASQRSRPFSREGIQQTIDNVRKKWFREDDLVGGTRNPDDDMMTSSQEERLGPAPNVQSHPGPPPSHPMTDSQHSSSSQHSTGSQPESFEAYDSSLDKLNKSLTDLQGEIARLSLQQEQIKFLQSPQGYTQGGSVSHVPGVPPQSMPQQTGYTSPLQRGVHAGQGEPHQPFLLQGGQKTQNEFPAVTGVSQGHTVAPSDGVFRIQPVPYSSSHQPAPALPYTAPIMSATSYQPTPVSQPTGYQSHTQYATSGGSQHPTSTQSANPPAVIPPTALNTERNIPTPPGYTLPPHSPDAKTGAADTASEDSSSTQDNASTGNGFFVSFGDETPKRPKPRLGKDRVKKEPKAEAPVSTVTLAPAASDTSASSQPSQNSGFIIEDREITPDKYTEEEMARKKERIRQMQQKRKEDQERKRIEKEQETVKQREAQRVKQEETERKKMEEKARREQIYQQYLMRKQQQEDEENGTERPPDRPAKPKPRPKSMFVKATDSPPRHDDEGSVCSLDDLSARAFVVPSEGGAASSARSSPRPSHQIPKYRGKLRKAVSCNTLTQNGRQGGATYRRPPSPDLYRLRHGNRSNDSSETGSNAGSDYTGPKLFVKPSSKSNRHIIVNAISHCCLAGIVNTETKNKVLEIIAQSDAKHFLILFRDAGCQFKGLYTYAPESEDIFKIHGVGPRQLTNKMVEKFYKYNSGAKSFTDVKSTKHISVSIDAVVLHNALWKTGKSSAAAAARK